jgi:hypothetical protein
MHRSTPDAQVLLMLFLLALRRDSSAKKMAPASSIDSWKKFAIFLKLEKTVEAAERVLL